HECPLHTDPVGDTAHREVLPEPAAGHPNHGPFKHLDALAGPFDDFGVHPHGVARAKRRSLFLLLLLLELLDHIHVFFTSLVCLNFDESPLCAACCRRHWRIRAWSPDRSTSGTAMPRYSAGRVNCGQPVSSSAKLSCASEPGSPTTPGNKRATESTRTIAGISPPLRT